MHETIAFLQSILPPSYFYAAVTIDPTSNKTSSKAFHTVNQLGTYLYEASNAGKHAFYGLAGYQEYWHDDPFGRRYADGSIKQVFRTQQNAAAIKAFWLDIDAGPNKPYATQKEAANALLAFIKATNLPAPTLVSSGYGLHVYWRLNKALPTALWNKLAFFLERLTQHFQLHVDSSRTTDCASILRPVGTSNWKNGVVQPVRQLYDGGEYDVAVFSNRLIECIKTHRINVQTTPTKAAAPTPYPQSPEFMAAMGHTWAEKRDKAAKPIVVGCQQVREAGLESEPTWFSMMTVMKCCTNGREAAKILSAADKRRYNEAAFNEKYTYVESLTGGPSTCDTFNVQTPGKCDKCPHRGRVTSPAELGRRTPAPAASSASMALMPSTSLPQTYPLNDPRFEMIEGEGLYHIEEQKDKPAIKTLILKQCFELLYAQKYQKSFAETETVYIFHITEKNSPSRQVRMTADDFKSPTSFTKWLFDAQLLTTPGKLDQLVNCMRTYIAQMQRRVPQINMRDHFGWTTTESEKTTPAFIVGDTLYAPNMPPTLIGLSTGLESYARDNLDTTGTMEEWKKIPQFYKRHNLLWGQFALCLGFGATLMKFAPLGANNGLVNFWTPHSGAGKTTVQMAVNSLWGKPLKQLLDKKSSDNPRFRVAGWRHSLPICIDEITNIQDYALSDLLFNFSEGCEKLRMTSNGDLRESGTWNTITITSANTNIVDKMLSFSEQRDAEIKRAIDIEIPLSNISKDEANDLLRTMNANYGHAGREFIQHLLNSPRLLDAIPTLIDKWTSKHSVSQDERFWEHTVAVAIIAGTMAKQFGLIDFDMKEIEQYALQKINEMRRSLLTSQTHGNATFSDYLSESLKNSVVVTGKKPDNMSPDIPLHLSNYIKRVPMGSDLDVRIELDTNTVYVRCAALREWCKERKIIPRTLLSQLAVDGLYDPTQGTLRDRGHVLYSLGKHVSSLIDHRGRCYKFTLPKDTELDTFVGASLTQENVDGSSNHQKT